jgi:hypothetical protein
VTQFKAKATYEDKVRIIEFVRTDLTLDAVKEKLATTFAIQNVSLLYVPASGSRKGLYQDFHLEEALKDSESSGARYFELQVSPGSTPAQAGKN